MIARLHCIGRITISAVMIAVAATTAHAADATLFRLFLKDGSTVVSFGEYSRVGDRVVFSMPVGGPADQPRLHVVTLPASVIDWSRTDRYADSARYYHYASTRGEADFVRLTNDVARVLNEIALTTDRSRALAYAEEARLVLVEWPREHYGYRQKDVREIVTLLDESISDLRAALGITSFDLAFVASPADVALEQMLPAPAAREQLDQIFRTASLVERPADRVALLQSALLLLAEAGNTVPAADADLFRRSAEGQIEEEHLIDSRYGDLSRRLMVTATSAAARARVRDVERVLEQIPREDRRLGHRRPQAIEALRASVHERLDAARRLRLMRDQWIIRSALYRDYERSIGPQLTQLIRLQPALDSIRRLDGPAPRTVIDLRTRLAGGAERLARVQRPDDLRTVHDLIVGAWQFAENALNARLVAIQSGDFGTAQEASSAAAGSQLLFSRAEQEIRTLMQPPQMR
jgi:hypothetical protein